MKTYNTYQKAKIANPEDDIYVHIYKNGFIPDSELISTVDHVKCNPSDYCMTVEEFLKAGHRLVEGDLIFSKTCSDKVVLVTNEKTDRATYSVSMANAESKSDNKRYILRAAALGKPKRTKVEYVKVTESIFDLRDEFERGELYFHQGCEYLPYKLEAEFAHGFMHNRVYRRIETEIDERQEFIDAMSRYAKPSVLGKMFDAGCRFVN